MGSGGHGVKSAGLSIEGTVVGSIPLTSDSVDRQRGTVYPHYI